MQPQRNNNVKGLSLIVTVSGEFKHVHIRMLISILGHHCLQRVLRHHSNLPQNLTGLLFPANHHRTLAKNGHLQLYGHQYDLRLHLLRHRHLRLRKPKILSTTHGAASMHIHPSCHDTCQLCTHCIECSHRLDHGTPPHRHNLEFEHATHNKVLGLSVARARSGWKYRFAYPFRLRRGLAAWKTLFPTECKVCSVQYYRARSRYRSSQLCHPSTTIQEMPGRSKIGLSLTG
jgi:hypothetical protein